MSRCDMQSSHKSRAPVLPRCAFFWAVRHVWSSAARFVRRHDRRRRDVVERRVEVGGVIGIGDDRFVQFWQFCHFRTNLVYERLGDIFPFGDLLLRIARHHASKMRLARQLGILVTRDCHSRIVRSHPSVLAPRPSMARPCHACWVIEQSAPVMVRKPLRVRSSPPDLILLDIMMPVPWMVLQPVESSKTLKKLDSFQSSS